jgi:hypothetical protein
METYSEHGATPVLQAPKRKQRERLPAPKFRSPRGSVRRFNTLVHQYARELGFDERSLLTAECELIRQAAALALRAEQLQAGIVRGEPIDPDELIRLSSEGRRVLRSMRAGVKPEAPPPPPWSPMRSRIERATDAPKPGVGPPAEASADE